MGGNVPYNLCVSRRGDRVSEVRVSLVSTILCLISPPCALMEGQGVGSDGLQNVNPLYGFLKPDKTPGLTTHHLTSRWAQQHPEDGRHWQ